MLCISPNLLFVTQGGISYDQYILSFEGCFDRLEIKIKKIPSPFISLSPIQIRLLNRALKGTYTTEQLLHILKDIKFADVEKQGFMPVYERQKITDDLHETCGFRTDYQFITKRKMKGIQKKSKRR